MWITCVRFIIFFYALLYFALSSFIILVRLLNIACFREEKSYCVNIMISLMFFGKILKHDFSEGFLQKPIIDVHCVTCHEGVRPKFEGCGWERGEFLYFCGHHKKKKRTSR